MKELPEVFISLSWYQVKKIMLTFLRRTYVYVSKTSLNIPLLNIGNSSKHFYQKFYNTVGGQTGYKATLDGLHEQGYNDWKNLGFLDIENI